MSGASEGEGTRESQYESLEAPPKSIGQILYSLFCCGASNGDYEEISGDTQKTNRCCGSWFGR